jgi:NosR/NirI family transcriptional regulator, nitrous oxide reductase regulator
VAMFPRLVPWAKFLRPHGAYKPTDSLIFLVLLTALLWPFSALAEDRVQRFPAPDFKSGYVLPPTVTSPVGRDKGMEAVDVMLLAAALGVAAHLIYIRRSRQATMWLAVAGLVYFGFIREGCICPVGSIQNVAFAAGGNGYALPWTVAAFFVLPLVFALFYGRVFCSGVCPLGAIQDLVLWRPVTVPAWVEMPLGLLAWAYLGLAVVFAACGSDFFICRYDPFVGFFRLSGPAHMILAGGVILFMCLFVGRVYCRFLCPYSVLLRLLSKFSRRAISITPRECVDCRLCEQSCPFGAIRTPMPVLPRNLEAEKRRLLWVMSLTPVLVAVFAALGYVGRGAFSHMDATVVLAEKVYDEQQTGRFSTSDETRAWRGTGQAPELLYERAATIQRRYAIALPLFGAWMGLAIGGSVRGLLVRRRRGGYTADASACVACARCYATCPVEKETGAVISPATIT